MVIFIAFESYLVVHGDFHSIRNQRYDENPWLNSINEKPFVNLLEDYCKSVIIYEFHSWDKNQETFQ